VRPVSRQLPIKGYCEKLHETGKGPVLAVAESKAEGKLANLANIHVSGQGAVAVTDPLELPIHFEVFVQVGPSVACADVAAGKTLKGNGGAHCQPPAVFLSHQDARAIGNGDVAVVARGADLKMRDT
jgi:hypothetical protein